ncbi:MAG: ABC transporter permease [Thermoproteota archaeon]|jgi:peptide/nickel transport system permease protein
MNKVEHPSSLRSIKVFVLGCVSTLLKLNLKLKVGLLTLLLIATLVIFEPVINRAILGSVSPITPGIFKPLLKPSKEHLLGTDLLGRDLLALSLHGLKYSFLIGIMAGFISSFAGIIIGFISGYKGGFYDSILRTITDFMIIVPTWPILAILATYIKFMSIEALAVILAIFTWPLSARIIRSQVLSLKERPYVDLAKVTNLNDLEIILFELMPNILPYIGVGIGNAIIGAMLAETGLEVIGLGPGNIVTLGSLLNWALGFGAVVMGNWNILLSPVSFLILVFLSFNLINIGLDEAYNPRLKKITGE